MDKEKAIEKAVDEAIKENLLEGFFKIHRAKVIGMCLTEYDEEEFKRVCREDGYTDGLAEGEKKGAHQKTVEAVKKFYANKVSPEIIADSLDITLQEVESIIKAS